MKKSFITGLVILLPLALTLMFVAFIVKLLTGPFLEGMRSLMIHYGVFEQGLWWFSASQMQVFLSRIAILIVLCFVTLLLGTVARWMAVHYFIKFGDSIIHKIPLIRTVYKTLKDLFTTMLSDKGSSFKQVVMVRFPHAETHTIGLITRETIPGSLHEESVAVFIPTTPNPTSGFFLIVKKSDVIYLDLTVEEALKYIISCGVVASPLNPKSQ